MGKYYAATKGWVTGIFTDWNEYKEDAHPLISTTITLE